MTIEYICPDFPEWPKTWMGDKKDIPYGRALLDVMRLFIEQLIDSGQAKKTIKRHLDNLWVLGGEIIRDVNTFEKYNLIPLEKLKDTISPGGGPLCRDFNKSEQKEFDATCRKLYKFLQQKGL